MNKEYKQKKFKSKFTGINNILPRIVADLGLDRHMHEKSLFSLWPSWLDPQYASRSTPLYIDTQGVLVVAVENGSVAQELSFLKAKVLNKLQPTAKALGLRVTGMRFDLKQFRQPVNSETNTNIYENTSLYTLPVPDEVELAEIELNAAEIDKIAFFKKELQSSLQKLHSEQGSNHAEQATERISSSIEKRLRYQKWCVQKNVPVCKQCSEPLSQLELSSQNSVCAYCAHT